MPYLLLVLILLLMALVRVRALKRHRAQLKLLNSARRFMIASGGRGRVTRIHPEAPV